MAEFFDKLFCINVAIAIYVTNNFQSYELP